MPFWRRLFRGCAREGLLRAERDRTASSEFHHTKARPACAHCASISRWISELARLMPTTDCLPIMYVEGMAGWGCVRQSRLPLDLTAASSIFARRGPLPQRVAGEMGPGCLRRERRGAISFEKTDKSAIYLRRLGDARAGLQLDSVLQQKRRKGAAQMEPCDKAALQLAASTTQQKAKLPAKHMNGAHEAKQQRSSRQRHRPNKVKEGRLAQLSDDCYEVQAKCQLAHISSWTFDVFSLDKTSRGRSLFHVTVELVQLHGLTEYFSLDMMKLMKFATLAEDGYRHNPYHNSIHAADVTQAMHCYISEEKLRDFLTPLEKLAALVAAVTHDLDHPGQSQGFLVATDDPLSRLYNKTGPILENHHWRSAMGLLQQSGLVSHFSLQLGKLLEQQIKSLILATDMSRQQEFFARFKAQLQDDSFDLSNVEHRHFLLQIALKCADISNTCRPWDICKNWSEKVCEEFFQQGDEEKKRRLPVSYLCDRNKFTVPKIQLGFIDNVVAPLFRLWERFSGSGVASQRVAILTSNRCRWQELSQSPEVTLLPLAPKDVNERSPGRQPPIGLSVSSTTECRRLCSSSTASAQQRRDDGDDDECAVSDRENRLLGHDNHEPAACNGGELRIATVTADLDPDDAAVLAKRLSIRRHSTPVLAKLKLSPLQPEDNVADPVEAAMFGTGGLPPAPLCSARRASLPLVNLRAASAALCQLLKEYDASMPTSAAGH